MGADEEEEDCVLVEERPPVEVERAEVRDLEVSVDVGELATEDDSEGIELDDGVLLGVELMVVPRGVVLTGSDADVEAAALDAEATCDEGDDEGATATATTAAAAA